MTGPGEQGSAQAIDASSDQHMELQQGAHSKMVHTIPAPCARVRLEDGEKRTNYLAKITSLLRNPIYEDTHRAIHLSIHQFVTPTNESSAEACKYSSTCSIVVELFWFGF